MIHIIETPQVIPNSIRMTRCVRCWRRVPYTETDFYAHTVPVGHRPGDLRHCARGESGRTCDDACARRPTP